MYDYESIFDMPERKKLPEKFIFESLASANQKEKIKKEKPLKLTEYRLKTIESKFNIVISYKHIHKQSRMLEIKMLKKVLIESGLFNQLPIQLQTRMTLWANLYSKNFLLE